jgi:hypothetical protein
MGRPTPEPSFLMEKKLYLLFAFLGLLLAGTSGHGQ